MKKTKKMTEKELDFLLKKLEEKQKKTEANMITVLERLLKYLKTKP